MKIRVVGPSSVSPTLGVMGIDPTCKCGPWAQFEESRPGMVSLFSPGMVPVISGGLLGFGRHSKGRNCRLPAPVTGRLRLFYRLIHNPIFAGVRNPNHVAWCDMAIPDDEDEFLAQFLESEVLSEVSDKVLYLFLYPFIWYCLRSRIG